MYQNQGSKKEDVDGMVMIGVCLAAIVFFSIMLWMRFHVSISTVHVFVRNLWSWPLYQLYVISVKATGSDILFLRQLLANTVELCAPTSALNPFTSCTTDPKDITFKQLSISSLVWNVIFGVISLSIAIKGYLNIEKYHPLNRFNKTHTLDSFMDEQKQNYPHLRLFSEFNLQHVSARQGPLMGMKTSREFAKENHLVVGEAYRELKYISDGITKSQKDSFEKVPVADRNKLIEIARVQLGGLWVSVDNITDVEAILLARYLPTACSTDPNMPDNDFHKIKKEAAQLEEEYWRIATDDILTSPQFMPVGKYPDKTIQYPDGKKDLSLFCINELKEHWIKPFINHPVAKKLLDKHAYTRTFIISVVFQARRLGVAAPCQMRWLKFYDREMWALLSNIGRPSFFAENMGAISHYQAEAVARQEIYQPHLDVAIRGFEYQLQTYFYSDEDLMIIQNISEDELDEGNIFNVMPLIDSPDYIPPDAPINGRPDGEYLNAIA